jgi:peptidoglycan hydrolase-like protein with peptidoglycan-binding domain
MKGAFRTARIVFSLAACALALTFTHSVRAQSSFLSADLRYGDTSPEVRDLQAFLNGHGFALAKNGAGSPLNETLYFGLLTKNSLIRFQSEHGLPATGFFGPLTRAAALALLGGEASSASTTGASPSAATPDWITFFNEHAPGNGWTPGFGGGGTAAAAPADTTPPSISLTAPAGGATLAGSITLQASASDDTGVASVQFEVDGTNAGAPVDSAPYTYEWDSAAAADGAHVITATARDGAGNTSTSGSVTVNTLNTPLAIAELGITANQGGDSSIEVISWTTNQLSSSKVIYGLGGTYNLASSSNAMTTSHGITLAGLTGGTWKYKVVSTNAAGVTATSSEHQFTVLMLSFNRESCKESA